MKNERKEKKKRETNRNHIPISTEVVVDIEDELNVTKNGPNDS